MKSENTTDKRKAVRISTLIKEKKQRNCCSNHRNGQTEEAMNVWRKKKICTVSICNPNLLVRTKKKDPKTNNKHFKNIMKLKKKTWAVEHLKWLFCSKPWFFCSQWSRRITYILFLFYSKTRKHTSFLFPVTAKSPPPMDRRWVPSQRTDARVWWAARRAPQKSR